MIKRIVLTADGSGIAELYGYGLDWLLRNGMVDDLPEAMTKENFEPQLLGGDVRDVIGSWQSFHRGSAGK